MKKVLPFIIILVLAYFNNICYPNYITPGAHKSWNLDSLVFYSGGNVTYSNGNYFINDTITISPSDTIKIFSNATIKLAANVLIDVWGIFLIRPPDSVKITAIDTTQQFLGILMDSLSSFSMFKKLIFEYGNSIRLMGCNMLIDSCTIRKNTMVSTVSSSAINLFRSNPMISHCKIYRNRRAAISSGANIPSSPQIIGNLIFENDTENGNYPQINFGATGFQPLVIRDNTIRGYFTMAGGISILPVGTAPLVIIENNIIKNNRYGIAIQDFGTMVNAYINGNIIDSNNIQGIPLQGGSGINFNGTSSQMSKVTRNVIRWNLWGITIQGTAKPNLGDLNSPDTTLKGLNRIYYNVHNDSTFDLYNNTPDSIKAENNYWGTLNLDTIELHIFHKPDNPALGFVDYLPIWTLTNISNQNSDPAPDDFRLYDAYPNPFNPRTKIHFAIPALLSFPNVSIGNPVTLKIYDILGREIQILVNEKLNPGIYEVTFDGSNLPSGIYFYRLQAGSFSQTKKMVLLK